ncbi:ABC transporter permease [Mycolicibacterium duvalii]|uniref:ABC transporter permease n=1 Tax=Mycolicibacterium duvalii TaxID=39688 RepID=A0A7I7K6D8_9MYCO|nr:ABC transporter permease [Mycolicibacterium duvalii]MCV7369117.1 ABC transporter permease [Mycolicibacterium duvalii]PEG44226.1 ABC transporter permease [Mycolicibacterium duvalii]BBX18982.1 ABC transporter permease [Mycolicibacterium duvalii]
MTLVAALHAERIKLLSVRSALWSAAVAALLSFGIAALQASVAYDYERLTATTAALGVAVFGVPVLTVLSAMTLTGEYRSAMIATTFAAVPRRTVVMVAKAVVAAVFCSISAAAMVLGSAAVVRFVAPAQAGRTVTSDLWPTVGGVALYAALAAVLGVGVAGLVRHTAGAVAVLLLWPLLVEPLLGNLPGRGAQIGPYLPFANIYRFLDVSWLFPTYVMRWGAVGSLLYFAALAGVVFAAAVVVVNRRDA